MSYISATNPPELSGNWDTYTWMVVCGGLASAFMAWGIGANDAANSFATSVGSKTLTLWQAVIICAIFEFLGAMVLGGEVAKTVASKIADVTLYEEFPEMYMYGMLCSLAIAGLWLLLATMWCLPVSTTHSITGAIMGYALVFGGWGGVVWFKETGSFPFCSGFTPIVLSWFFSPIIGGILSAIIFNFCRFFILRRQNSTKLAIYFIPFLIFITFFICLMFVLAKGAGSQMQKRWPCYKDSGYKGISYKNCSASYEAAVWISAVVSAGIALITGAIAIPLLLRKVRREAEAAEAAAIEPPTTDGEAVVDVEKMAAIGGEDVAGEDGSKPMQRYESIKIHEVPEDATLLSTPVHYSKKIGSLIHRQVIKGLFYDVHMGAEHNAVVARMHEGAEVFKPETEKIFSYLQVVSACCVAFAHGSNDVANSVGPFSAIYTVYKTYEVPGSSSETAKWIFAMGGGMIVVGLATYGYNIIMTIGVQLLKLTPSRGFAAELAAGLTIALASFFGIPVSTTQIIVGAETGVGLSESLTHGLNFWLLLRTFMGWIWTIVLALAMTAALFAMGAYAPSIPMSQQISACQGYLYDQTSAILTGYIHPTNLQFENDTAWWSGNDVVPMNGSMMNKSVVESQESFDDMYSEKGQRQLMFLNQVTYFYDYAVQLNNTYARTTIGTAPQPPVTVTTPPK